jgi:paraquat-inducible protein B
MPEEHNLIIAEVAKVGSKLEREFQQKLDKLECQIRGELNEFVKNSLKVLQKINKNLDEFATSVKENANFLREMDETQRNIFLAIRQNEYLQAWYPEQHEFPEMKVVGPHPGKTCRREND